MMALRICLLCTLILAWPALAQDAPDTKAPLSPSDAIIYDQVRQALTFDADVRGAAIEVTVKEGDVLLRGRVRDNKAREKAAKLAQKVKGVKKVTNELRLFTEK